MSIRAGIDVGTNAVKGCVARVSAGRLDILREMRVATRLGEGWSSGGRLMPSPMARTCAAIRAMVEEAKALGAERVRVAGTSAAREAANTHELAACLRETCGETLEILSGEEEARLSFRAVAVMEGVAGGPLTVFDAGGGSTEWAQGEDGRMDWARSLPIGAVRLTEEMFTADPVPLAEMEAAAARIQAALDTLPVHSGARLIGTGGTVHTMARVHAEAASVSIETARRLSRVEVERQVALYAARTAAERAGIPGVEPQRADIILAGALIVRGCLAAAGADRLLVSDAGVRHALLLDA